MRGMNTSLQSKKSKQNWKEIEKLLKLNLKS